MKRGKVTCTAFSELFLILSGGSGLKVGSISSVLMKHRWNYVVIGAGLSSGHELCNILFSLGKRGF